LKLVVFLPKHSTIIAIVAGVAAITIVTGVAIIVTAI